MPKPMIPIYNAADELVAVARAGAIADLVTVAPDLHSVLSMFVAAVDSWQDDGQPQDASEFIALIETTAEAAREVLTKINGE